MFPPVEGALTESTRLPVATDYVDKMLLRLTGQNTVTRKGLPLAPPESQSTLTLSSHTCSLRTTWDVLDPGIQNSGQLGPQPCQWWVILLYPGLLALAAPSHQQFRHWVQTALFTTTLEQRWRNSVVNVKKKL